MEYQMQAIMENRVLAKKKKQKGMKNENPSSVKFSCRGCNEHACSGEDIEIIEDMHRVNLTPQFRYEVCLAMSKLCATVEQYSARRCA